ncbi:MAG: NmrA family NAD(P)-binding protein [Anaerolineae bacterium]|nr:NmrA family NAD(P)-binding protein [Anaerolineae bacterium]
MILVTGGTGFIGRHLVKGLMAADYPVRVLLNEARVKQLDKYFSTPPEVVTGTVLDDESLFRAVSGAQAIIHLENAMWWGRRRDLERIELAGARKLITAARAARVGRIVFVSQLGAAPASAYALLRYKGLVEEAIKSSGIAYTIIRSGLVFGPEDAFFNHIAMQLRTNPFFFLMPGRGEVVLHPLYIDDLISALLGTLQSIDTVDRVIEIGGPEYITLEDLIRTIMRVSGAGRPIIGVPPYLLRWMTALYSRLLPRALITQQWMDILASNRTARIGNLSQYFNIRPKRLEDTLITYMRGRNYGREIWRNTFRRHPRVI